MKQNNIKNKFIVLSILSTICFLVFILAYCFLFKDNIQYAFAEPFKTMGNFITANVIEVAMLIVMYGFIIFLFVLFLVVIFSKKNFGLKVLNVILSGMGILVAIYGIHGFYQFNFIQNFDLSAKLFAQSDVTNGIYALFIPIFCVLTILFVILATCYSEFAIVRKPKPQPVASPIINKVAPIAQPQPVIQPKLAKATNKPVINADKLLFDALMQLKTEHAVAQAVRNAPTPKKKRKIVIVPTNIPNTGVSCAQYYGTNVHADVSVPGLAPGDIDIEVK
ncbi:MAG: hypothetical protein MJ227_04140 [Bacilli bacterium]|nr:hypothetical protein [Bacilli bacterium]